MRGGTLGRLRLCYFCYRRLTHCPLRHFVEEGVEGNPRPDTHLRVAVGQLPEV